MAAQRFCAVALHPPEMAIERGVDAQRALDNARSSLSFAEQRIAEVAAGVELGTRHDDGREL